MQRTVNVNKYNCVGVFNLEIHVNKIAFIVEFSSIYNKNKILFMCVLIITGCLLLIMRSKEMERQILV